MAAPLRSRWIPFAVAAFAAATLQAQPQSAVTITPAQAATGTTPPPPPPQMVMAPAHIVSPQVYPTGQVTFRFLDPNAQQVLLSLETTRAALPMARRPDGVWEVTVGPLQPDFYGYSFVADGVSLMDPNNSLIKPNLLYMNSMVHVPGPSSLPWELNDVPHGVVRHHFYRSATLAAQSDYYVYTPPGYDRAQGRSYPVLYLLHGYSDDAGGWTAVGRANVILDNLIAWGKARPMIIVMPLGYGVPAIVERNSGVDLENLTVRAQNFALFRQILLTEIMPRIEREYVVGQGPEQTAIAGLSMGGAEALLIGLNDLSRFGWVGSFSAGAVPEDYASAFPGVNASINDRLHLLYVACGTSDTLIGPNRRFRAWLASEGVRHDDIETPGAHSWPVWRRNLAAFAPLLFRP